MLFEVEAFDDMLATLGQAERQQLKTLALEFRMAGGAMTSDRIKKWQQEQSLREILRAVPEFFCRGEVKDHSFKNNFIKKLETSTGGAGFNLRAKVYQKNCFYDGARRNLPTTCWVLQSADGIIEFLEEQGNPAVKILFFATAGAGNFFQLKRLVSAARKLLLVGEKNLIYGRVLEEESDEYPFKSKRLLQKNLALKNDGLSRLHHLYLKLGAENLDEDFICWRR